MRTFSFLIILLSVGLHAHAQTDSVRVWNKWCARKDTMLLFNAANNIIEVYSPTLKPADIKLKSLDNNSFRVGSPDIKGDTLTALAMPYPAKGKKMRLAVQYKKTGKTIKIIDFTSADVPELVARVGAITGPEATRATLLAQSSLKIGFPNSLYSYPYGIKQFTFKTHYDKGGATVNTNGFLLTKDMFQQIKDAPAGTVIEFTGIKATCPQCAVRTLDDIKLKIK